MMCVLNRFVSILVKKNNRRRGVRKEKVSALVRRKVVNMESQGLSVSCVQRTIVPRNQVAGVTTDTLALGIKKVKSLTRSHTIPGKQREVELVLRNNNTCLVGSSKPLLCCFLFS